MVERILLSRWFVAGGSKRGAVGVWPPNILEGTRGCTCCPLTLSTIDVLLCTCLSITTVLYFQ